MNNVTVDDSKVQNLFRALDSDSRKRILFTALKAGGNKLAENTKIQLRSKLGAGATSPNRWNGKTMESGIRIKADKDYCEVDVNVMGDFRLKFFEKGTKLRQTKKTKANRGSIRALYFFQAARNKSDEVTGIINSSISESLKRISTE